MTRRTATAQIVGVHEEPLDVGGRPCPEVAVAAVAGALRDAGLPLSDVDGLFAAYSWEEPSIMFASEVANSLGIEPRHVDTVCFGGASPAMMVSRAARAIAAGSCEVAVLVAASNRASGMGRDAAVAALRDVLSAEFEVPYGAFVPPVYALAATRFMYETGTTARQLAAVAVTQREHARLHPGAARQSTLTVEDVLASPTIASPLRRDDCCLVTDFGAAVVMTSPDRVPAGARPVAVLGSGESHNRLSTTAVPDLTRRGAAKSARIAMDESGLGPDDIDLLQLYDSFTITVLMTLEDMGISPRGEAGLQAERGDFRLGGRLPLNTNGGMLSYRTGGFGHVIEAVHQLRGSASGGVAEGARTALAHGIGGVMSSHCTLVLGGDP